MALSFVVPGDRSYQLEQVVFDLNGTLANGGEIAPGTLALLGELAQHLKIHLVTADTHGTARHLAEILGGSVEVKLLQGEATAAAKAALVQALGAEKTVAVGNGANDVRMLEAAALAIAVIGQEGCFAPLLPQADLLVTNIDHALNLLLKPQRIVATLRQ